MRKKSSLDFMKTIVLGTQQDGKKFTLSGDPLQQHKIIMGKTGQGKSKFISTLPVQLKQAGIPFAVVDSHRDLCDDVLASFAASGYFKDERAYEKLWYIDFSHKERHIPFNVLKGRFTPHETASHILEAWKRAWSGLEDGNAVQLENVLLAAMVALIINKRPLTDLSRFLSNETWRQELLEQVTDPLLQEFFASRFTAKRAISLSESTMRRAFLLSFSPVLRNCLSDVDNLLDFRYLMDNKISVIFDLSNLDEQTQRFLGCLITIGFEEAALSRANMDEDKRGSYHLFMDEFAQYSAQSYQSLERMLTLTRKFGLTLILVCQRLAQTGEVKDALSNCLPITFQLGYDDSRVVATWFLDDTQASNGLMSFFVKDTSLVKDGQDKNEWVRVIRGLERQECLVHVAGTTFLLHTLNVPEIKRGELTKIKEVYAQKLLRPNKVVGTDTLAAPAESVSSSPLPQETTPHSPRRRVVVNE